MKKLLKGILVLTFSIWNFSVFAQIAHINEQDLMQAMPEMEQFQQDLKTYAAQLDTNYSAMTNEYLNKKAKFQQESADLPQSIRDARAKELSDMETRITEFQQTAQQDLQNKQQELLQPILDKINAAIATVAKAKHYKYVFDTSLGNPVYSEDADNIMDDVKKELGITE